MANFAVGIGPLLLMGNTRTLPAVDLRPLLLRATRLPLTFHW